MGDLLLLGVPVVVTRVERVDEVGLAPHADLGIVFHVLADLESVLPHHIRKNAQSARIDFVELLVQADHSDTLGQSLICAI